MVLSVVAESWALGKYAVGGMFVPILRPAFTEMRTQTQL